MKIYIKLFILLFFQFVQSYGQEADPISLQLSNQIEKIAGNHTREEIYVQTSKDIYETSEDLWFKASVLNSQYYVPSLNTQTLYVSLLQLPEKKVVWEEKYAVVNGFTYGHIYLQDTLQSGYYALVSQTGLSVNQDEAAIKAVRKIEIIKNIFALKNHSKETEPVAFKAGSIDFRLMPEGGHLVSGVTSKVAFKAVDRQGNPVEVKGTLYNGAKAIPGIVTFHAGMGSFYITPTVGTAYSIKLDGYPDSYPLPNIKSAGQVLQMLYKKDNILAFKVAQSTGLPVQKMHIRLQIRGVVYSMAQFELKTEKLIKIQTNDLPQGIAEVTLFNADLQPVAERLVFVNEDTKVYLTTTLDKTGYGTKEKVKLKLTAADEKGNPVVGHFGMSVSDDIYQDPKNSETIESYYLLSTQIKGRICDPGYYFNAGNKGRQQALDLLLLTQGWRAYQWSENYLVSQNSKKHPFVSDTLTGSIYAKKKKADEILGQQYVMTYCGDKESEKTFIEVNNEGYYKVLPEAMQYNQRGYVYFKLLHDKDNIGVRRISDPGYERLKKHITVKELSFPLPSLLQKKTVPQERFKVLKNINQLEEVVLTAKVKKARRFADKYMGTLDSLVKSEVGDYVCDYKIFNCSSHPLGGTKPIEGTQYYDPVSKQLFVYKYRKYTEDELLEKFSMTRIKGYYPPKEFYSPVYDKEIIDNTDDFRNTLFWKPDLITGSNGTAEVEFFTSDINSKFRVVVEGVTAEGLLGSHTAEFKVEKKELE